MEVSYHINDRVVTHSHVALTTHQEFPCLKGVDRAGRRCQCHGFEDFWVVAHDGDAADLQAQTALFLWCTEQPCVLAAVALRVLLHRALGASKDANLEGLLVWD